MVGGPGLGIDVAVCPLKDRVRDGIAVQVQLLAYVGGQLPVRAAKADIGQQQPIAFEVKNEDGRLRQCLKPILQPARQFCTVAGRSWHAAQQGLHGLPHKVAAVGLAVVVSLGVELPAIFGHQRNADEVGPGKIGEFGVQENQHAKGSQYSYLLSQRVNQGPISSMEGCLPFGDVN